MTLVLAKIINNGDRRMNRNWWNDTDRRELTCSDRHLPD